MAGGRRRQQQQLQLQLPRGSFPAYPTATSSSSTSGQRRNRHTIYSLRCLVLGTAAFVAAIGLLLIVNQLAYQRSHSSSSTPTTRSRRSVKASSRERNAIRKVDPILSKKSSQEGMPPTGKVYGSPLALPDDLVESLDAVLVLGGGRPSRLDEPPLYVQNRCDDAARVVTKKRELVLKKQERRRQQQQHQQHGFDNKDSAPQQDNDNDHDHDLPVLCLSAGTAHVPQLLSSFSGLPVWESTASSAYLMRRHNLTAVFVETTSYDTIGNAYYARTSHTEWNGWRKLLIVTSEFHMERSKTIFDWIFSVPRRHDVVTNEESYRLHYLSSPNVGLDPAALAARRHRETSSLESVHNLSARYGASLSDVWKFLHTEHDLYAAAQLVARSGSSNKEEPTGEVVGASADASKPYGLSQRDAVARSYGA